MPSTPGHTVVSSGVTVTSVTISTSAGVSETLTVLSGGVASASVVGSGGLEFVSSGGVTYGDAISSGGSDEVFAGGLAVLGTVASGGEISGAGLVTAVEIYGLISGAQISNNVIPPGDSFNPSDLYAGGEISNATIEGLLFQYGGAIDGGSLSGDFSQIAASGGTISGLTLRSGGDLDLTGAVAQSITISSGGLELVSAGAVYGDIVSSGGTADIFAGGITSGATVFAGGTLDLMPTEGVTSGGFDTGTTLRGGTEDVSSGATIEGLSVLSGRLIIASVINATSDYVYEGGTLELQDLQVADGPLFVLSSTYASQVIEGVNVAGGAVVVDGADIVQFAGLELAAGAVAEGVTVSFEAGLVGPGELAGDVESLDAGVVSGVALGDANGGHGALSILSGGVASSVTEAGAGDYMVVGAGGEAVKTRVTGGGATLVVDPGGVGSDTVLANLADTEFVYGSARATTISNGGVEYVEAGGLATLATVRTGGLEYVFSGATTSAPTISSRGTVSVAALGRITEADVLAGGVLVDNGDAIWAAATTTTFAGALSGAGRLTQEGPGLAALGGTTSAFTGEAVISAGTIELTVKGALASASVAFAATTSRKVLEIAAADRPATGGAFAPVLSNFDATTTYIELAGLTFISGATASRGGATLTLHDGAYSASFALTGSGASAYAVFTDGAGGTEIRAAAGSTVGPLAQAMATFPAAAPSGSPATPAAPQPADEPRSLISPRPQAL